MSDYGDDYSDYGEEWFYVEDEYMAADDLAEHAVASPPPVTYGDEDMQPDWDRFDYFNDIEYASDGYDDATFQAHNAKDSKIGQKRKRATAHTRSSKRRRTTTQPSEKRGTAAAPLHSPIVWRSQNHRDSTPKLLQDNAQSYALLRDWREKLADTPCWARASPDAKTSPNADAQDSSRPPTQLPAELASPTADIPDDAQLHDQDAYHEVEDEINISQDALMAALQRQLAAAGGPLSGMDPQQLLQFAMRMATDKDAGDDIAGEMADAILQGNEEDNEGDADVDEDADEDAQENLLSWVAQQRNRNKTVPNPEPESPDVTRSSNQPPTPPSSEANRSINQAKSKTSAVRDSRSQPGVKRKAGHEEDEAEGSTKTTKKRATRSFDAPTASSQAKAAPARPTRSARTKR